MTQDVEMNISLTTTNDGGSTLREDFQQMITGQNQFFSDYTHRGDEGTNGTVILGTDFLSNTPLLFGRVWVKYHMSERGSDGFKDLYGGADGVHEEVNGEVLWG